MEKELQFREKFLLMQKENEFLHEIIERSEKLGLDHWAVGAGFLQQSTWNMFHHRPLLENIKDIDWVYYDDTDLSEDAEKNIIDKVHKVMTDIPIRLDIKNQARVHVWYENKFGYPIKKYDDLRHAISTWPTTSTAVALTQINKKIEVIAPFGFSDLMTMTVRANKAQITKEIYMAKLSRWSKLWPNIKIIKWEES